MENSAYMDSVTSARSMLLTEEEALAGGTPISCETTDEFGADDIYVYCQEVCFADESCPLGEVVHFCYELGTLLAQF
jgi:hypothetical protein